MKIGTLSVNINTPDYNYGALLHSYAFIEYLKKTEKEKIEALGGTVEVI